MNMAVSFERAGKIRRLAYVGANLPAAGELLVKTHHHIISEMIGRRAMRCRRERKRNDSARGSAPRAVFQIRISREL
jgi:hypothetical protein